MICISVTHSEQSQQFNKIYLSPFYRDSMLANTDYTYSLHINPSDGMVKVINAMVTFQVYYSPTVTYTLKVNGASCNNPSFTISTTYAGASMGYISFDCSNVITTAGAYNLKINSNKASGAIYGWLDITYVNNPTELTIHGTEYCAGDAAGSVWLQLLNANQKAINNASCVVDIYKPNNTRLIEKSMMSFVEDGVYKYDIVIPTVPLGVYKAIAECSYATIPYTSIPSAATYNGTILPCGTGGTITTIGNYTFHTFTSNGTFVPCTAGTVSYLVVGGGGAGGGDSYGGGGGAGGLKNASGFSVSPYTPYTVIVGRGGIGVTSMPGGNGTASNFSTIGVSGGGGGGRASVGYPGGSGGGASSNDETLRAGGAGKSGQGNAGGSSAYYGGGGGGGKGSAGTNRGLYAPGGSGFDANAFGISNTVSDERVVFNGNTYTLSGANWRGQSFTPSMTMTIKKVKLLMKRTGTNVGTVTVQIKATSSNLPTGSVLASGTINGNALGTSYNWTEFSLGAGANLTGGTIYAWTVDARNASSSSADIQYGNDIYASGKGCTSSNSGTTWSNWDSAGNDQDTTFEIWGTNGFIAGGGGGAHSSGAGSAGPGRAGGGYGSTNTVSNSSNGLVNTGGGGGGGSKTTTGKGSNGGSGIVVIKYLTSSQPNSVWQNVRVVDGTTWDINEASLGGNYHVSTNYTITNVTPRNLSRFFSVIWRGKWNGTSPDSLNIYLYNYTAGRYKLLPNQITNTFGSTVTISNTVVQALTVYNSTFSNFISGRRVKVKINDTSNADSVKSLLQTDYLGIEIFTLADMLNYQEVKGSSELHVTYCHFENTSADLSLIIDYLESLNNLVEGDILSTTSKLNTLISFANAQNISIHQLIALVNMTENDTIILNCGNNSDILQNINQSVDNMTIFLGAAFAPTNATMVVGQCNASSTPQILLLALFAAFAGFLIYLGFAKLLGISGFLGSVVLLVLSWYIVGCSHLIGYIIALLALILLVVFAVFVPIARNRNQ